MDNIPNSGSIGRLVQYQERRNQVEWQTVHVYFREDDYEYFLDLKKLLKMSVSLILAFAVEKYLDKLIRGAITDNNRYRNYLIIKEVIDNLICWRFIWGFPANLEKVLQRSSFKSQ